MSPEEHRQGQESGNARQTEARGLDFDDETQESQGQEEGSDDRIGQEADQAFGPVDGRLLHRKLLQIEFRHHVGPVIYRCLRSRARLLRWW